MNTKNSLNGVDVEAVADAIHTLTQNGFEVQDVTDIDRQNSLGRVRFQMTVQTDTRNANLRDDDA